MKPTLEKPRRRRTRMVYVIRIWLEKIKETENQAKVRISQGLYITAFLVWTIWMK